MITWSASKNMQHDATMLKVQLSAVVKLHKPAPKYVIDDVAAEQGFEVLHSPVGHCELNLIELIWAQVKGRVARLNQTFRLKDVKELVH